MRLLLPMLLAAAACYGQGTLTLSGPATARPGTPVELTLDLAGVSSAAGVQWTMTAPPNTTVTPQTGAAAEAASKVLECDDARRTCVVVGLNSNPIAPGQVAKFIMQVGAAATRGIDSITLDGLILATVNADSIPVTAGAAYSLRILARSDLDGDGYTNWDDVRLMLDQVFGRAECTGDQNGDGKCDLIDVMMIVKDAMVVR
jgi:hypothetical protein